MNLSSVLDSGVRVAIEQEQQCRRALTDLRQRRCRAEEDLLEMCCNVQRNPSSLDPERMSFVMAEIRYLGDRAGQLEEFLERWRRREGGQDADL